MTFRLVRFLAISSLAVLTGCQLPVGGDPSKVGPAPIKAIIDIPKSLVPTADPQFSADASRTTGAASHTSFAYGCLKTLTGDLVQFASMAAALRVEMDEVIAVNHLEPSSVVRSGLTLALTPSLVSRIKAALCESLRERVAIPESSSVALPSLVYNHSSSSWFTDQVSWTIAPTNDGQSIGNGADVTLSWNADGTRLGYASVNPQWTSLWVAYDAATGSSSVRISRRDGRASSEPSVTTYLFKSDPAHQAEQGTWVKVTASLTGPIELHGYGDLAGGVLDYSANFPEVAYTDLESFTSAGVITYQDLMITVPPAYQDALGFATKHDQVGTALPAAYSDKLGPVDYGDAGKIFAP